MKIPQDLQCALCLAAGVPFEFTEKLSPDAKNLVVTLTTANPCAVVYDAGIFKVFIGSPQKTEREKRAEKIFGF
jgi:hypothetical protein